MTYEEERIKLENANVAIKEKQLALKLQRKVVHKEFVKKHKTLLLIMDIFVISLVLVNFGTALVTNALVVKVEPETKFMEANTIQVDINDYEEHPEGKRFMTMLLVQSLLWAILLFGYIHSRMVIYKNSELLIMMFILIFYTYLIYYDFVNDFGYYLGTVIWG